jgi:hypothetical protein
MVRGRGLTLDGEFIGPAEVKVVITTLRYPSIMAALISARKGGAYIFCLFTLS